MISSAVIVGTFIIVVPLAYAGVRQLEDWMLARRERAADERRRQRLIREGVIRVQAEERARRGIRGGSGDVCGSLRSARRLTRVRRPRRGAWSARSDRPTCRRRTEMGFTPTVEAPSHPGSDPEFWYGLTMWGSVLSAQVRSESGEAAVALNEMGGPGGFVIPAADARRLRDLLNIAAARGEL